ncbi:MAG: sialate O-acetylesterase, partial [Opitutaceae bacterium]|nr:sialate O-acetylesterase [Opitutaceae bacterium]
MKKIGLLLALVCAISTAHAELKLPAIIGEHMVLQQKQANPIWGWDTPGTAVSVTFAGKTYPAIAGADGKWSVKLDAAPANAAPQTLVIAGTTKQELSDVLIGEVWMCSGQSNMGFKLASDWNGDLEAAASKFPQLRLISVPTAGSQELKIDFKGQWRAATPETASKFSAVGFLYGRYLHEILGVPVGLIDNSWGGSAAEAWIRRETIEADPRFQTHMGFMRQREAEIASGKTKTDHEAALA